MREQLLSYDDPECWRPVGEYLVSSHGRVANLKGDILNPDVHWQGYLRIKTTKKPRKNLRIHLLVAEAFLGPRPPGYIVDHLDEDKTHNCPINMEYVTIAENNRRYRERKAMRYDKAAA